MRVVSLAWLAMTDSDIPPGISAQHNLLTDLNLGQIIGVVLTIGILIGIIKKIHPVMKSLTQFLEDWNGRRERPGVEATPGVMETIADLGKGQAAQAEAVAAQDAVLASQNEVLSHLRRAVEPIVDNKAAGNHQEVLEKLGEIAEHHGECDTRMKRIERLLQRHLREQQAWVGAVDKATAERGFQTPPWPNLPDPEDEGEKDPAAKP